MKMTKGYLFIIAATAFFTACAPQQTSNTNVNLTNRANVNALNANAATSSAQSLSEVARPQKIADMMKERGEQEKAMPTLKIIEPKDGASLNGSTVKVKVELGGELKGYKPMKDMATGMGNHIHLILDNQPYEPFYNAENEFEFRGVADGEHTLRVFPSRPWHESYKNEGAFQAIKFTVKGGAATVAANSNQTANVSVNTTANASATPEGKDMPNSSAGAVDFKKPLLTYSRPKGEYKGADTDAIMIDFWLSNAKLQGDGGEYLARYSVDGGKAKFIDKWQPVWLSGWTNGKHTVKLELIDKDGNLIDNGGYNSTTREIIVTK
ncbi:MAG: hypothetical protein H0U87_04690 [Acidobacteria bacterium]|nr:hypothetical protein [Acidobacteriota bacterium]